MVSYGVTGITLQARKFGDGGRVVSFFTLEQGKVEAVARGIGKSGSKLAAACEPFTLSRLQLVSGRQLHRLSQIEVITPYLPLRENLIRYSYGAVLLELVQLTTEVGAPMPDLFADLQSALGALAADHRPAPVLWAFSLRLLAAHGADLESGCCVECGNEAGVRACYLPQHGGFVCPVCSPQSSGRMQVSGASLAALRALQQWPLDRLDRLALDDSSRREIGRVVRSHTQQYVGDRLKSLVFLDQILRAEKSLEGAGYE
jgi:DNA repair protein RecO (recombination protein O)